MTIKLKVGDVGRRRDGKTTGALEKKTSAIWNDSKNKFTFYDPLYSGHYRKNGQFGYGDVKTPLDIILVLPNQKIKSKSK